MPLRRGRAHDDSAGGIIGSRAHTSRAIAAYRERMSNPTPGEQIGTRDRLRWSRLLPDHGATGEALLRSSDEALYRAKQEGRDWVILA